MPRITRATRAASCFSSRQISWCRYQPCHAAATHRFFSRPATRSITRFGRFSSRVCWCHAAHVRKSALFAYFALNLASTRLRRRSDVVIAPADLGERRGGGGGGGAGFIPFAVVVAPPRRTT